MKRHSFKKQERLKGKKEIAQLFESGESFSNYPLRLIWRTKEFKKGSSAIQFGVSVPKRKFPSAVHRNKIKRRVREAYRINNSTLKDTIRASNEQLAFFIIYVAKEHSSYAAIEKAMQQVIKRFLKKWKKNHPAANLGE